MRRGGRGPVLGGLQVQTVQEVYRMAIRIEDADQVRAAIRRGGRVRVKETTR